MLVEDRINQIQTLASDKLVMQEAGFIEIFIDNEAQTPVYYDNMQVTMRGGSVTEVNAYYPYGMRITNLSTPEEDTMYNSYRYNAKELQTELNLNWLDYGNRMQDPIIGRFWVPDRFSEKYYHLSPYSYAGLNPMTNIDINGDSIGKNILDNVKKYFGKVDDAMSNPFSFILNPIFGQGSKLNELSVKMQGSTYGEWEGHADGALTGNDFPDYVAGTISGDFFVGVGVGGDINFAYVKGDGFFINATGRTGSGFDVSVSGGVSWGNYKGLDGKPTGTSLSGIGVYENAGAGALSGGAWQDIGTNTRTGLAEIAPNWSGGNANVSLGTKSGVGGSFGASYTTKPFYIYKK